MTTMHATLNAHQSLEFLGWLSVEELREAARVLGIPRGRHVKGGTSQRLTKAELIAALRRTVGRGTFRNRLDRFAALVTEAVRPRLRCHTIPLQGGGVWVVWPEQEEGEHEPAGVVLVEA